MQVELRMDEGRQGQHLEVEEPSSSDTGRHVELWQGLELILVQVNMQ